MCAVAAAWLRMAEQAEVSLGQRLGRGGTELPSRDPLGSLHFLSSAPSLPSPKGLGLWSRPIRVGRGSRRPRAREGLPSVPRGPPHALEDNLRAFWTLHSSPAPPACSLGQWASGPVGQGWCLTALLPVC